jgi:hypothetical protein
MISLTGTGLLVICGLLAAGLPVFAVVCWSRVRGPRAVRSLQRILMVAGSQLAAVLLVAVALNDYGAFYGTWSSLLRGSPGAVQVRHASATSGAGPAAGRVQQVPDASFSTPAQWPTRGRLESLTIRGANSALSEHAQLYLPPQYFQAGFAASRFPVIEVLAGFGGGAGPITATAPYPQALLSLLDGHRGVPSALVLLRPSAGLPRLDAYCTDVPAGPQAAMFYTVDVPAQLAAGYRLRSAGWGALGVGDGGYCAARFAMTAPQTFTAAVSVDGPTALPATDRGLWAGSSVLRAQSDLSWRLQHLPAPPVSLRVVSSSPAAAARAQAFVRSARPPMLVHQERGPAGTQQAAAAELAWLTGTLTAPVPAR